MDLGWITTLGSSERMMVQVSFGRKAAPGHRCLIAIEYGPTDEPWGVRRFYAMTRSASSSIFSSTTGSILRHLPMAGGGT
jgi:hypothetical protein